MNIAEPRFSADETHASTVGVEPIAVVGIGCRLPGGANDAESFWNLLVEKRTGIVDVPSDRWNVDAFYDPNPEAIGRMKTRKGGFLPGDVFSFDPSFFDMSPREALSTDPQQRMLLQVAYEAIQSGRTTVRALQKARTGVFIGISAVDFAVTSRHGRAGGDIFAGTGFAFSIAANRISHRFNFSGPSMAIDTACSSALVSIDQAVRSLSMGSCDYALAGGVNCMLEPGPYIAFSNANMLSPTGAIYTFDRRANGFVRGEGCGLVLLRPLSKAVAAGDRIYGVIRQSMVNQDGNTPTITAPSGAAQEAMLTTLMERSDIDPLDVDYVEAHGTGTPVGDPIEATAIGRAFGQDRVDSKVYVGSVKPNVGHLEAGAGIAGFLKALLSANHGIVPPNLNFEEPNPEIPFDALKIAVATEPTPYASSGRPNFAAVNSFGFGGTNCSVLIEGWRTPRRSAKRVAAVEPETSPVVVPLSASSSASLGLWAGSIADAMEEGGAIADRSVAEISDHMMRRRDHFGERAAILVEGGASDLKGKLRKLAAGEAASVETSKGGPAIFTGRAKTDRKLAFGFSGQGGQWWRMSRRLLEEDRIYRRTVEAFDEILKPRAGWSAIEEMMRDESTSRINDADVTQAAIFSSQIGLFEVWKARGITPDYLVGHSFGEVAVAHLSGAIDLETAARIILTRGQVPLRSTQRGAMAAIGLTVEQLAPFLVDAGRAWVAAYNGPIAQTIAGDEADVVALMENVAAQYPDALVRRLTMNFGWHTALLNELEDWFRGELGNVVCQDPRIPIISTVTGMLETRFDADYWWENLRQPVSFTKAVRFALDLGITTFLELGPHRTITPLIRGIAQDAGAEAVAVPSLDRTADDYFTLASSQAALYAAGITAKSSDDRAGNSNDNDFVKQPWSNQRLIALPQEAQRFLFEGQRHPLLGWRDATPEPSWTNEFVLRGYRFLEDHRVSGDCLFPAVGYMEVMGAALRDHFGDGPVELRNLKLYEAFSIGEEDVVFLSTRFDPVTGKLRIFSQIRGSDDGWRLRAEAYGYSHRFTLPASEIDLEALGAPDVEKRDFYEITRKHGLEYGPTFQLFDKGWSVTEERVVAVLSVGDVKNTDKYFAFPGLFDSVLQSGVINEARHSGAWVPGEAVKPVEEDSQTYSLRLPIGARKVLIAAPLTGQVIVDVSKSSHGLFARYQVFDMDGNPLISIEDLETKKLGGANARSRERAVGQAAYSERFEASLPTPSEAAATPLRWLAVAADPAPLAPLAAAIAEGGGSIEFADTTPFSAMDLEAATKLVETFCAADPMPAAILFSGAGVDVPAENCDAESLLAATSRLSDMVVTLGQVLGQLRNGQLRPRLAVLSHHARQLPQDGPLTTAGLVQSSLVGLARTVGNECQEFPSAMVDADDAALAEPAELLKVLLQPGPETEIVLRGGGRWVPRVERHELGELSPLKRVISKATDPANFAITMTAPGVIDNIVLREANTPVAQAGEVIVEVAAVGLNFRDIMAATSILPDEYDDERAWWRNLGLECAGIVRSVGEGVDHVRVGDRVMGMGKSYLRRFAVLPALATMPVPDDVALEDAATIPTAFITAHYALAHVGRLTAGEKALIHLGSGGVGLAAIQVARHIGAEVLTTAGSDEKREHLKALGVEHVMNSRSLDFAEDVIARTGKGVDVVLNALSGSGIDKGLECLAPFGRFVEIGKRDLADDKPIGLRSLYHNNSYSVIDLSTMVESRPMLMKQLLVEVSELLRQGVYKPISSTRFPVSQTAEAMRTLFKAQHIGKIVVTFDEPDVEVEVDLSRRIALAADGSYLVTGGLRGFGVAIGDWLSQVGAGRVILANRSGVADDEVKPILEQMTARGTEVVTAALDVSDAAQVRAVLGEHTVDKPLRGIVHGAAVIEDGFLNQLDHARIERVLRPKVAGAWNLGLAAEDLGAPLDFFVSFSSMAQVLGSVGQANYTAANAFLNGYATYRRTRSQAGSAVAWGAIGGSGFVARSEAMGNYLDSVGMKAVLDTDAAASLSYMLRAQIENLAFGIIDWNAVSRTNPRAARNPRIQMLFDQRSGGGSRIQAELAAAPREEWEKILADLISREVGRVLKVEPSTLSPTRKLSELGLDSLSSFELKNRIEAQVNVDIPVAKFLQTPTIAGLAKVVANAFDGMLKAQEAAKQRSANAGTDGGSATQEQGFRPLFRQRAAISLPTASMSSASVKADQILSASAVSDGPVEASEWAANLARLAETQDAIRLVAEEGPEGPDVAVGEAPTLGESLEPIGMPGPLWRFAALPEADGKLRLDVRAHRAAADPASMDLAVAAIVGGQESVGPGFSQRAASLEPAAGTPDYQNHLAYWREVLHRAPASVPVRGRKRALAPTGCGINRGRIGTLAATIALGDVPAIDRESLLLTAWTRALGAAFSTTSVVVETHHSGRSETTAGLIGPLQYSIPHLAINLAEPLDEALPRARNALAAGKKHCPLDTAAIEDLLRDSLRARSTSLRQFGFAYAGQPSLLANEAQLVAKAGAAGLDIAINVDTDVFGEEWARSMLERVMEELAALTGGLPVNPESEAARWSLREVAREPEKQPAARPVLATPTINRSGDMEIPLYANQVILLKSLLRPDVNLAFKQFWTVAKSFIIKPSLDLTRMKTALDQMMARHESLRTRVEVDSTGEFKAFLASKASFEFKIEDVDDEAAAMARMALHEAQPLDPFTESMLEVMVIRFGDEGAVVVAKGHHLVFDGWSLGLLMEETLQAYVGLPLAPVAMTIREFVEKYDNIGKPDLLAARDNYLREVYRDPVPLVPNLGRKSKGLSPLFSGVEGQVSNDFYAQLDDKAAAMIRTRARGAGVTENNLVMAAYAQTIAANGGVKDVILNVPMARRLDRKLEHFVAWVASGAVIRAPVSTSETLEQLASGISAGHDLALQYLPYDDIFLGGHMHDEIVDMGSYTNLFACGSQTAERWAQGALSSGMQRLGSGGIIELGPFTVKMVDGDHLRNWSMHELEFRTIQAPNGIGFRCAYGVEAYELSEVQALFTETLDRLGVKSSSISESDAN
jgi:acyl transferase domain-containing protein/NADPH:quinone reductase-like Zn-dependent oxidoreductase/acyl carrier protein